MKQMPSELMICLVGMMLCSGCSVKEDRSLCPCRLMLDFSEVDTSVVKSADLVMTSDDGYLFADELDVDVFRSGLELDVPKGDMVVGVWSGTEDMLEDGRLEIPLGRDCPPVYSHCSHADTDCEVYHEKVILRKNHCCLTVNLKNMEPAPVSMRIGGNVNGYLPDGSPSEGEFSCELETMDNVVVLPRQIDDSLFMEVVDGFNIRRIFALGDYIRRSGYDWTSPELRDMVIDIDIALTGMTLVIKGWDKVYSFDIVI